MAKGGTKQAIFFDLHGILIQPWTDREDYIRPRFIEGAVEALQRIDPNRMDLFIATNQEGVAMGVLRERDFRDFQDAVMQRLTAGGIRIRKVYACLYHPKGKGRWRKESVFRKPNVGMFKMAEQEYDLNLRRCWLVGHTTADMLAGSRAGVGSVLVETGAGGRDEEFLVRPNFTEPDFAAAIRRIAEYELARLR